MANAPVVVPKSPQDEYEMPLAGRVAGNVIEGTADAIRGVDKVFSPLTRGLAMAGRDAAPAIINAGRYLRDTYGTWGGLGRALAKPAELVFGALPAQAAEAPPAPAATPAARQAPQMAIPNDVLSQLPAWADEGTLADMKGADEKMYKLKFAGGKWGIFPQAAAQVPAERMAGAGEVQKSGPFQYRGMGQGDTLVDINAIDPTGKLREAAAAVPSRVFAPQRARYADETVAAARERVPAARQPRGPSDYETGVQGAQGAEQAELAQMGGQAQPNLITYQPVPPAAQVPPEQHIANLIGMLSNGNALERLTAAYQLKQYNDMLADQRRIDREDARDRNISTRQIELENLRAKNQLDYFNRTLPGQKELVGLRHAGGDGGSYDTETGEFIPGVSLAEQRFRQKIRDDIAALRDKMWNQEEGYTRESVKKMIKGYESIYPWLKEENSRAPKK